MARLPLVGDGEGNYRIHLVGNSAHLSTKLNIPHIALDPLFWGPGWAQPTDEQFREKVSAALAQDPRGWIVDGDYGMLGSLISDSATDTIWLDPPLMLYLPRLLWRTFLRLFGIIPTCSPGCEETWGEFFSKKSIVWFCVSNHGSCKQKYGERYRTAGLDIGGNMRRLNEWNGDLDQWKAELEDMLRQN
ncbi:hypothetical protein BJ138DRAFT_1171093 [Hygrophoropsis aurantiaca]|uniref:Uncharacterized protein n=1 Tax=Hygrophoropsis aurantiaca TaxID=72124 RepID=A0ACB8AKX6_9AGAM|nr:hypothetical protein BJ138DRAFT_1171093 [Hygrophoropsis aurantiaca]